jgi:hypothetical protein
MGEKEVSLEQKIAWVQEEIEQDEFLRNTRDFSNFHQERINENRAKLQELIDIRDEKAGKQAGRRSEER